MSPRDCGAAASAPAPPPPPPPPEPLPLIEGPLPDGGVDRRQQVAIQVAPVAAKFTRTDTGEVVCEEAEWCYVPIDVDVKVEHRSYRPLVLSGDDLYDRRGHHWRVILRKK
ncbi:MAG: hypothetical protein H6704_22465 [Myxococcales bacterium]|nr:hypothetical protein [Myxococcales bacterium]